MDIFLTIKPAITVVHVLSVVIGMGAALSADLLFHFFSKDKHFSFVELRALSILSRTVWYSLVVIIVSGILLFLSDIEKYSVSTKFLAKMTIMLVLLINGFILDRYVWKYVTTPDFLSHPSFTRIRRTAFVSGSLSVLSWLFICTLGALDSVPLSYTLIISAYLSLVVMGGTIALLLEKRDFENTM